MAPATIPNDQNVTEVVAVRHGKTAWNVSGKIQERLDNELNNLGRQQAAKVARRLSRQAKLAAVYSSDLKRAAETAKTITEACPGSKLVLDQRLTEMHMGDFQGMKKLDVPKTEAYKAYASKNDRNEPLPGGGESYSQLSERCVSCLNEIADKHKGERVAVVSHELVIQELCRHADPTTSWARREIPNASITILHISGSDGHWILDKVGDVRED